MMCALTLLLSAASSRFLLQSSLSQSGSTSDVDAIHLPSGDQTGSAAPVEIFVTCSLWSPSWSITQTWLPVVYAIFFPSGDQRGALDERSPEVNCFMLPPSMETV